MAALPLPVVLLLRVQVHIALVLPDTVFAVHRDAICLTMLLAVLHLLVHCVIMCNSGFRTHQVFQFGLDCHHC